MAFQKVTGEMLAGDDKNSIFEIDSERSFRTQKLTYTIPKNAGNQLCYNDMTTGA